MGNGLVGVSVIILKFRHLDRVQQLSMRDLHLHVSPNVVSICSLVLQHSLAVTVWSVLYTSTNLLVLSCHVYLMFLSHDSLPKRDRMECTVSSTFCLHT